MAMHCAAEKKNMQQLLQRYQAQIKMIQNDIQQNKISNVEGSRKIRDLTIRLYKTKKRIALVKCQAKNCKKETSDMVYAGLETFIRRYHPSHPYHKFANKYLKIFKKSGLTAGNMQKFDIEFLKLR